MKRVLTFALWAVFGVLTLDLRPAAAATAIAVCVGPGGSLRLLEKNGACKPGEQKRLFAEWEPETPEPPDTDDEKALRNQVDALSKRLAALERKKAFEEDERTPSRVTAPFEVVAPDGTVILRVAQRVGHVNGGGARVTIGGGEPGNYAVRVHDSKGGKVVAGIGQGKFNHDVGAVVALDDDGDVGAYMDGKGEIAVLFANVRKASMIAEYHRGIVGVFEKDNAVAFLTKSSGGDGGNVTVSLNSGFGVFSAGAAQDGGGEACVNRVTGGGQQRRACLGIELPSMGLGK